MGLLPADNWNWRFIRIRSILSAGPTQAFLFFILISISTAGYGLWIFGSLDEALAYLNGHRLTFDGRTKDFGVLPAGATAELVYQATNRSSKPLTIIGMRTSCSCAQAPSAPIPLAPSETKPLQFTIRNLGSDRRVTESVTLYTDWPEESEVYLRVNGSFTNTNEGGSSHVHSEPK